jgi:hypothetical protein
VHFHAVLFTNKVSEWERGKDSPTQRSRSPSATYGNFLLCSFANGYIICVSQLFPTLFLSSRFWAAILFYKNGYSNVQFAKFKKQINRTYNLPKLKSSPFLTVHHPLLDEGLFNSHPYLSVLSNLHALDSTHSSQFISPSSTQSTLLSFTSSRMPF